MRGAVAVTSTPADFAITRGEDKLATYRFNTGVAEHHFCSVCGIYTHHKRRSNPNQLGVNVGCLEGVSPFDFDEVRVLDGQRHSADNEQHRTYLAGVLRFEPALDD
ncbi:MAG: GFA family protein [Sphingomonas sp.]